MQNDIFDRIMGWQLFSPIRPFYQKHKEMLLYLFFGGLTFFFNLGCYALCTKVFHWSPLISNVIAWVFGVLFAYITNRTWVFNSTANQSAAVFKELVTFAAGRLATLLLEEAMLWAGIELLHSNDMIVKLISQIAVIIGNYIISKWVVFRKKA